MKKNTKVSAAQEAIKLLENKKINNVQKNFIEALKQSTDYSKHKTNKKKK